jgi:SpoVK/Ycf46/Vps4 family AAA+-type ATPase
MANRLAELSYDYNEEDTEHSGSRDSRVTQQWTQTGLGQWSVCGVNTNKLPSNVYTINASQHGIFFLEQALQSDELIRFVDGKLDDVLKEVELFWTIKAKFDKYGFLHRRGFLLYGPPGTGKSCLTYQLIDDIVKRGGVAFYLNTNANVFAAGLKLFRQVEPYRPIVCIYEDLDAIMDMYGEESILSLLDGENQLDNLVNIATTNYLSELDKRITNRPRRFDRLIYVGPPEDDIRSRYFEQKFKSAGDTPSKAELAEWAKVSEGMSFAAMTELMISVKCFDIPLKKSAKILQDMKTPKIEVE